MSLSDRQMRERVARIEALLAEVESLDDPARAKAVETVRALLELYGEGLARVMAHAGRTRSDALTRALVGDELVSHLLLLHDLHPSDRIEDEAGVGPRAGATSAGNVRRGAGRSAFVPLSALGAGGSGARGVTA